MNRRKRVSRKVDITIIDNEVSEITPDWYFEINSPQHGLIHFDFRPFQRDGRSLLAAQLRDAVWSLRRQLQGNTLRSFIPCGLVPLWKFLDSISSSRSQNPIACLYDIDTEVIRQYLAWISLQVASRGKNRGKPWTVSWKKGAYERVKTLIVNRQKLAPHLLNPELSLPKNPFPRVNHLTQPRQPYTDSEIRRILEAVNIDLRQIENTGSQSFTALQILAIYLIALAIATGRNAQSLLDLRRDSLRSHPLLDREILVTEKRRGYSTQTTTYLSTEKNRENEQKASAVPLSVGGYVRAAAAYTSQLSKEAPPELADYIFLYQMQRGPRLHDIRKLDIRKFNQAAENFRSRHNIKDDQGLPLRIYLGRIRPTFGSQLYAKTRDVRKVQQALGHASPLTTARHYIVLPENAERDHAFVGQAMVGWVTSEQERNASLLAADGKIPLESARELLKGGYNTLVARCRNPFRESGSTCIKYLPCFTCPQMVVFEDDLWRLFSFYYKLLQERIKMNANDWSKTYAPIIKIIDNEIAPNFSDKKVEAAKERARNSPHPAWPRSY